jgi:hypothetical protein
MTEGVFHRLVSNLRSLSEEPSSNLGGKGKEEVLVAWLFHAMEVRASIGSISIVLPVFPVLGMLFIIHQHNSNR